MVHTDNWKKLRYLRAGRILDAFQKKHNICNIRKEGEKTTCNGREAGQCDTNELCCIGCSHLTSEGCDTVSLGCKMHYCYFGKSLSECGLCEEGSTIEIEYEALCEKIRVFLNTHDIPAFRERMSMEDTFRIGKLGLVVVAGWEHYDSNKGKFKEDLEWVD